MEAFENLKRRLLMEVSNREEIPADVTKMIKEAVIKLEQLYQRNGTINGSIEQYMEGTIQEVNAHLKNRYGEDRRTMHFTDAQQILNDIEKTFVTFRKLSNEEIINYINSKNPLDKAGSYGIQDEGFDFAQKIDGNIDNVIGFPIILFKNMLDLIRI